jgi:hypothetical protein
VLPTFCGIFAQDYCCVIETLDLCVKCATHAHTHTLAATSLTGTERSERLHLSTFPRQVSDVSGSLFLTLGSRTYLVESNTSAVQRQDSGGSGDASGQKIGQTF